MSIRYKMDQATIERRLAAARVARLATTRPGGGAHVVPICFAIEGDTLYFAIDQKPKRTRDLQRLRNIEANAAVSILVDHYEADWGRLWWIRLDGHAREADGVRDKRGRELLIERYPQYRKAPPAGPVVAVSIGKTATWESR